MCVCVCVRLCICVCVYLHVFICMYVRVYLCMCVYVCIFVYLYVCVYVCVYMCVCVYVSVCVYMCVFLRVCVCGQGDRVVLVFCSRIQPPSPFCIFPPLHCKFQILSHNTLKIPYVGEEIDDVPSSYV